MPAVRIILALTSIRKHFFQFSASSQLPLTVLTVVSGEARHTVTAGRTAARAEVEALVHTVRTNLSLTQTAVDLCDVARRAATRPRCNVK